MKIRNTLSTVAILCVMAATLATLAAGTGNRADAREREQKVQPRPDGYGMTTGLVGIAHGQTAQLAVWNKGKEPILVRLQFVNSQDEAFVPILCNAIIQPGGYAVEKLTHPGGANRLDFQAQYGTSDKNSLELLVPTLQVIDEQTGANSWMIGPEGFVAVPIYMN